MGGILIQDYDNHVNNEDFWVSVTKKTPSTKEYLDLMKCCLLFVKHFLEEHPDFGFAFLGFGLFCSVQKALWQ